MKVVIISKNTEKVAAVILAATVWADRITGTTPEGVGTTVSLGPNMEMVAVEDSDPVEIGTKSNDAKAKKISHGIRVKNISDPAAKKAIKEIIRRLAMISDEEE